MSAPLNLGRFDSKKNALLKSKLRETLYLSGFPFLLLVRNNIKVVDFLHLSESNLLLVVHIPQMVLFLLDALEL